MNADEIIRSVRATADSHKTITDFPLEAFPKKMIGIISRMVEYNRYSLDFIGSAILSASATAIGNSRKIRIYGDFIVNPALYMLFVARSDMGKTPPTNAAYRLIKEMDNEAINSYKSALYEYEKAKEESESKSGLGLAKPKLVDDEGMNDIIEIMNATEQDSDNDSRDNKQVMMVAKLALILQLLRWACGESDMTAVDETSVSGAILLNNYFQECYYRLMDQAHQLPDTSTRRLVMLNNLPNEFGTAQAIDKAVEMQVAPRTVKRWLATLLREGSIIKKGYGNYTKCRR